MKIIAGLVFLLLSIQPILAQDASIRKLQSESLRTISRKINDSTRSWQMGGIYNVSLGQGTLSNWAAGGDDFSLSVATSLNLYACYRQGRGSWDNVLDLGVGYVKTSTLGGRKNDDRFDLLSKYGYTLNSKLNLATLANFRSQFFSGYSYQKDDKGFDSKKLSSAFLSPAYLLVSQGLDYKPTGELSIFVSPVTSRWVIVGDDSLAARGEYGVKPGHHSLNQLGAFATINYQTSFNKYITYKGRMDVFSNYRNNPQNADLFMTNVLSARFARIIAFSWNLDMIYDDDVELFGENKTSPALQVRSMIGVGLQVKI